MGFKRTRCTPGRVRGARAGAQSPPERTAVSGGPGRTAPPEAAQEKDFLRQKHEAAGLEIRERLGDLAPEELDRLGTLRTSMQAFWTARAERPVPPERGLPRTHPPEAEGGETAAALPGPLKAGLERFSGIDLSGVQVHYNSPRPARVGALAYTKGRHIYAAPGQEGQLPHEGWHAVQQLQGRVRPASRDGGGSGVNGERILEGEAQLMGTRAARVGKAGAAPLRLSLKQGSVGAGPAAAPVQGKLVDALGMELTRTEVAELYAKYPAQAAELKNADESDKEFSVKALRHHVTIEERFAPVARSFAFQVSDDVTMSSGSQLVWEASRHSGMNPSLARTDMKESLTPAIAASSPAGLEYTGAAAIRSGRGLQESGLARTHHLSDKAIRVIVEWLDRNRGWRQIPGGLRRVAGWMAALTGDQALGERATKALLEARTSVQLEAIVNTLSNNARNVGLGSAEVNRTIGPLFDESRTSSGIPTPVASVIAQFTEYLRELVPGEVIDAALGQMVERETGTIVHSMTAFVQGAPSAAAAPVRTVPFGMGWTSVPSPPLPLPGRYRVSQLAPEMVLNLIVHLARGGDGAAQFLVDQEDPHEAYGAALRHNLEFVIGGDGTVEAKPG